MANVRLYTTSGGTAKVSKADVKVGHRCGFNREGELCTGISVQGCSGRSGSPACIACIAGAWHCLLLACSHSVCASFANPYTLLTPATPCIPHTPNAA